MSQSHRASLIETFMQVGIGFFISLVLGWFVLPIWGFEQSASAVTTVTAIYTATSIIRAYAIRRTFNWIGQR